MTLLDEVTRARDRFVRAGVAAADANADAEVLARHALAWDRADWLTRCRGGVPAGFSARYSRLVARRAKREPVSLITGQREFHGLTFAVGPAVLTPRPETELIVETAIELLGDRSQAPLAIADIGTGSGCLSVTLARAFPRSAVTAVDVSPPALAVARGNAAAHGVADRIAWVEAPLADWLAGTASGGERTSIDLMVANLPYIPTGDLDALAPEVRLHEPRVALDGGPDGLGPLRELLHAAPARLRTGGRLIVEIGMGQSDAFRDLVAAVAGIDLLDIRADLQGIPRTAVIAADVRPRTATRQIAPDTNARE